MSHDTPNGIEDAGIARHELRAYLHNYGQDLSGLLSTLGASKAGMALDELWKRHGHQLPSESITKLLGEILKGLERLPYHVTLDDGAFRPPYKNAALRAEAEWHRMALQSLTRRLAGGA